MASNAERAFKVYNMWLGAWKRDISGALAIAGDFLDKRKDRLEFEKMLKAKGPGN